jgi:hypothetical protein
MQKIYHKKVYKNERLISIPFQKKPLKGTYLIGYLSEVIMVYSIINLDFDKEFKKNQQ